MTFLGGGGVCVHDRGVVLNHFGTQTVIFGTGTQEVNPNYSFLLLAVRSSRIKQKSPEKSIFPVGGSTRRWEQEGRHSPFCLLQRGATSAGAAVKPREGPWRKNWDTLPGTCRKPPEPKDKLSYGRRFVSPVPPLEPTGEILKSNLKKIWLLKKIRACVNRSNFYICSYAFKSPIYKVATYLQISWGCQQVFCQTVYWCYYRFLALGDHTPERGAPWCHPTYITHTEGLSQVMPISLKTLESCT